MTKKIRNDNIITIFGGSFCIKMTQNMENGDYFLKVAPSYQKTKGKIEKGSRKYDWENGSITYKLGDQDLRMFSLLSQYGERAKWGVRSCFHTKNQDRNNISTIKVVRQEIEMEGDEYFKIPSWKEYGITLVFFSKRGEDKKTITANLSAADAQAIGTVCDAAVKTKRKFDYWYFEPKD